ncbi:MAG: spore coat associated protein CotJA [Anaeromicrobium sp.]|jgi:hypothetical protein|uniref:spore coat associated protein CotJA n=1 Tax=Anaeromicrobium sp. TaxID=1929132 RepID=UPI0025CE2A7F|nr:spore coat associated protein CotJA [Anaeromicrobium sp.]MCT4595905.1 spore coat associated protein CotJA [Anaeromicrobium sp.]
MHEHTFPYMKEPKNKPVLARAYVPFQRLDKTYHPEEALMRGTLFPELYSPFLPSH